MSVFKILLTHCRLCLKPFKNMCVAAKRLILLPTLQNTRFIPLVDGSQKNLCNDRSYKEHNV